MPNDHSAATRDWGPAALTPAKQTALDWVKAQADWLSKLHRKSGASTSRRGANIDPPPGM